MKKIALSIAVLIGIALELTFQPLWNSSYLRRETKTESTLAKKSKDPLPAKPGESGTITGQETSIEDLHEQLKDIDHDIQISRIVERLNDPNLDPDTRQEFYKIIDQKYDILEKLAAHELRISEELLAGAQR